MPKVRRRNLPRPLLAHLLERIHNRSVTIDQLQWLYDWLETEPEVPEGDWFKRFPDMTVCGEGELVKTFLLPGQIPHGEEME
jgi:hypothetical protein